MPGQIILPGESRFASTLQEAQAAHEAAFIEWTQAQTRLLQETAIQVSDYLTTLEDEIDRDDWARLSTQFQGDKAESLAYRSLAEHDKIRVDCRVLAIRNPFAINIIENGKAYIIGTGHTITAKARKGKTVSPDLLEKCQQELDDFCSANHWTRRQKETWERREREGEAFRRFFVAPHVFPDGRRVERILKIRFIEPEQLTPPNGEKSTASPQPEPALYNASLPRTSGPRKQNGTPYDVSRMAPVTTFDDAPYGISFMRWQDPATGQVYTDYETPTVYHIRNLTTDTGRGGAYITSPIPASEVQHIKANVDLSAPRGIPTLWPVRKNLERALKNLRNISEVVGIQAAIAMIRKHAKATQSKVQAYVANMADIQVQSQLTGKTKSYKEYPPGAILDVDANTDYQFPAMAARVDLAVSAVQAELRAAAARVQYPEFMISADSSNNNYASIMVAESPATKKFECMQSEMVGDDTEVYIRALKVAVDAKRLPANTLDLIEVSTEPPSPETQDKLQEAQILQIASAPENKWIAPQTASARLGYKWDNEQELIKEAEKVNPPPAPPNTPPGAAGQGPPAVPKPPGSKKRSPTTPENPEDEGEQVSSGDEGEGTEEEPSLTEFVEALAQHDLAQRGGAWVEVLGTPVYVEPIQEFNPNQARVPAGSSGGGRFAKQGGGAGGARETRPSGAFDAKSWESKPLKDRKQAWAEKPIKERDTLANASQTVPGRIAEHLKGLPKHPETKDLQADLSTRVKQLSDRLAKPAAATIHDTATLYAKHLTEAGVDPQTARQLSMTALDTLAAQEMESMTRQLGDHGISHIRGNINTSNAIFDVLPQSIDARDRAIAMTAQIFHDTGYLTPPSRSFLDEGHPRWSAEHFHENIGPLAEKAFGKRAVSEIEHTIRTHDATNIDWNNDPIGSAVRVADNTSLFHKEKLPGLFRYAPDNLTVLRKLGNQQLTLKEAHEQMRANIQKADVPPKVRKLLDRAVDEVSPFTPKFTLGMLGGNISGVFWKDGHIVIQLKTDKAMTQLHQLGDFGQKQFTKFAEAYGMDPEAFKRDLNFEFKGQNGQTLLAGEMSIQEALALLHAMSELLGDD